MGHNPIAQTYLSAQDDARSRRYPHLLREYSRFERRVLESREGGDRDPDRREWGRQDDDAAHDFGDPATAARDDPVGGDAHRQLAGAPAGGDGAGAGAG